MSWHQSTLGEECELYQPQTLAKNELDNSGVYKVYGANGVIGTHSKYNHEDPQVLVTCRGATCGTINISEAKSWINGNAMVVKPRSANIDLYFLSHYLHHLDMSKAITGAAQPQITRQSLAPIKIQFPPLAQQQRIAAILDKAAEIKAKREQAIAKLDELAQSTFVEMFGDVVANDKGWQQEKLEKLVKAKYGVKAGPFGSALKKEEYVERGYKIYGQEQVIAGSMTIGDYYISQEKYDQLISCAIEEGDVLVSLVGSFGKVLVVPNNFESGIINPRLLKISPDKTKLLPYFLSELLKNTQVQAKLKSNAHGGTMGILNAGLLKELVLIAPPIELQEKFIKIRKEINSKAEGLRESAIKCGALIQSLQHQAFTKGFNA